MKPWRNASAQCSRDQVPELGPGPCDLPATNWDLPDAHMPGAGARWLNAYNRAVTPTEVTAVASISVTTRSCRHAPGPRPTGQAQGACIAHNSNSHFKGPLNRQHLVCTSGIFTPPTRMQAKQCAAPWNAACTLVLNNFAPQDATFCPKFRHPGTPNVRCPTPTTADPLGVHHHSAPMAATTYTTKLHG
jgi:hypothetical protein